MRKRSKIALVTLAVGMVASGLIASVAWFAPNANSFSARISGSVVEEYFHCGSGTQNDPFVITRPMHYYHLTEFFQRTTTLPTSNGNVTFGTDYLYFQVGYPLVDNDSTLYVYDYDNTGAYTGTADDPEYSKTLNLSYFSGENALMPIGTNQIPFYGSFDGGADPDAATGITIDHLNITTSTTYTEGNTTVTRTTSDAGVFGYVADGDDSGNNTVIANAYFNNLVIDLSGVSGTASSDSGHVNSHTDNAVYVGYIAGHIHTYTSSNATGTVPASPIHDVYINNAKIEGGPNSESHFGYVGFADTIDGENGSSIDLTDIINDLNTTAGTGGQGDDWGGSIDMKSLNVRLYNHLNDLTKTSYSTNGYYGKYESTDSKISVVRGDKAKTYYTKNPLSNQVFYNLMGNGNHTYKENYTLPGTWIPLIENSDGTVGNKNTGYIVSDSQAMNNVSGTVRSASYQTRYIANSLVGTAASDTNVYSGTGSAASVSYSSSNLEILTNKGTTYNKNNFYLIKDSHNASHNVSNTTISGFTKSDSTTPEALGLQKYNEARNTLDEIMTGESFIHGIHFMGTAISTSKTITLPTAKISGEAKTSYVVPKSCIDFNLKIPGYINFFGGSYYARTSSTGSYADSFFSLNYITRNASDGITSIKQINNIYSNSNTAEGQPKYVYQFSDNSYSTGTAGTLLFNLNFLMNEPPAHNALYYFEIPVNEGEYALGTVSGKSGGGYLMYLDIAATAEAEEQDYNTEHSISNDPIFTQMEYLSNGYVINSCFNIGFVIPAGATKENFWIIVSRNGNVFAVEVVNQTSAVFEIDILLVDNDDDPTNTYPYTYTLKYNNGSVSDPYNYSASFTGAVNGTELVRQTS